VIAQTTIEECDGVADERLEAMGMLNDEIKLWVTRCRQLVGVLQEVEMERDNCKAGEGHAKELGTGFKVKLGDTGNEANVFEEHTRTPIPLDNAHLPISNNAPGDAMVQQATESNNKLEESLARQYDLQARLDVATTERDSYRQNLLHEQDVLSEHKERLELSKLALRDLQAHAETIAKEQVSQRIDVTDTQSEVSYTETQSSASDLSVLADLRAAQQSLEISRSSVISVHRHYTEVLDDLYYCAQVGWDEAVSDIHKAYDPIAPTFKDPFHYKFYFDQFRTKYSWTDNTMLETNDAEFEELSGRDRFHENRSRSDWRSDWEAERAVIRFQSVVGQRRHRHLSVMIPPGGSISRTSEHTLGYISPSQSDKEFFPATWARWDQIYKDAKKSLTAPLNIDFVRSTRHGQWPEVLLVIYSWSFYKILDTDWNDTKRSKRLLKALVDLWWECESSSVLQEAPEFRTYRRSTPIITGYPNAWCSWFQSSRDSGSEEDTDESTDEETPAEHDLQLATRSAV